MPSESLAPKFVEFEPGDSPDDTKIFLSGLPDVNEDIFQKCLSMVDKTSPEQDREPLLEVDDKNCGEWSDEWGEGYSHHASFGDNGTTASVSRYGDIMQVTQYLGKGSSGIFSMDQASINEPYQVAARAQDLEELSVTSTFGAYTYGIGMSSLPSERIAPVKWLNWKWPRFEWQTNGTRVIFQYVVREGVVLHQLLFQNNSIAPQELPDVWLASELEITDLDCLHSPYENEYLVRNSSGPHGYGRVTIKPINPEQRRDATKPEEIQGAPTPERHKSTTTEHYQAVALIDMFIDGKRECMETWEGQKRILGKLDPGHVKEIVVAYKLSDHPKEQISWEDLMIPAEHANVSKFIREDLKTLGDEGMSARLLLLGLQLVGVVAEARGSHEGASLSQPEVDYATARFDAEKASGFDKMEYLTWRHLEHILSVCAVPISQSPIDVLEDIQSDVSIGNDDGIGLVALTCGDIYAFKFLIVVQHQLASSNVKSDYITDLCDRVQRTCEGQVKWLGHVWETRSDRPLDLGCFAANYWVTGEEMPEDSATWQPDDAMTDTALQILKITSYLRTLKTDHHTSTYPNRPCDIFERIQTFLTKIFVSWLHTLDKLDVRARYAWPHGKEDGVNTFLLEDHFWIWKALEAMEDLGLWAQLPSPNTFNAEDSQPRLQLGSTNAEEIQVDNFMRRVGQRSGFLKLTCEPDHNDDSWKSLYRKFHTISKRIVPNKVLRSVLQHFTATSDVLGSFLLDIRDNALVFDQIAPGSKSFFEDPSFKQLWYQTINVQPLHLENEEYGSTWYNIMRLVLSIMLGMKGKSLNEKKPPHALQDSIRMLLGFFGHNGFLGAHLDDNRKPVLFGDEQDRDSYYHASFEAMYMLQVCTIAKPALDEVRAPRELAKDVDQLAEILRCVKDISSHLTRNPSAQDRGLRHENTHATKDDTISNRSVKASNICLIEEEWMHNFPEFLSTLTNHEHLEEGGADSTEASGHAEMAGGDNSETARSAPPEITHYTSRCLIRHCIHHISLTFIADARKQKLYGQPRAVNPEPWLDSPYLSYNNEQLKERLQRPRTARDAKKRFIWLPQADCNEHARKICQAANASEAEKQAISNFFNRHIQYGIFYQDQTALALNSWQTELNLSFNLLSPINEDIKQTQHDRRLKGQSTWVPQLNRVSMGYRFDGDLFDRYWTCHLVESERCTQTIPHDHDILRSSEDIESVFKSYNKSREHFKQWWQRKILELLLTHRMLTKQIDESKKIFNKMEWILQSIEKISLSVGTRHEVIPTASDIWGLGEHRKELLQDLSDDLESTLGTLEGWNDREWKRGQETPRWTPHDEKKYRKRIKELQISLEQDQRRLWKLFPEVTRLQKRFEVRSKQFNEERERQRVQREALSDRNVRWFTYVTIVFAPLSFAEGFYSMGGAPEYGLIISLVKFCFAALAVTVAVILLTIAVMPDFKEWLKILEVWKINLVENEDGKRQRQPWDKLVLSVLDLLVIYLLYPRDVLKAKRSGSTTMGLTMGLILDLILAPVFVLYWLASFLALNLGDFCALIDTKSQRRFGKMIEQASTLAARPPRLFRKTPEAPKARALAGS
ncbi:hypothetical protein Daus18300_013254 [Diaporthe australafricana]|uniref:Uncharacterized protein n=1 Tax=Diaporthe australafricana TaxID=127596 RepID=A0ABR3VZN4_9PEZI